MTTESRPWYQTCWITLPSLAMTLIVRLVVRKDSANQLFLSNFLLTKIMARAKLFSPQSRHNFSRACVFSTLADHQTTNNMRRKSRRGGVAYGGQR